jgi:hypothetical protein
MKPSTACSDVYVLELDIGSPSKKPHEQELNHHTTNGFAVFFHAALLVHTMSVPGHDKLHTTGSRLT